MLSNNQNQNLEKPKEKAEDNIQKPAETQEVASKSVAPQPASQDNDKKTAQNIQSSLQSTQPQATPTISTSPTQPPGTAVSDEPYIKAAENVIEKDKDDPYRQEEDHEDVQVQYLKDRFGKDIKKAD